MGEQYGCISLRGEDVLRSFISRTISGPSTYINVFSYEVSGTMNTTSLSRVVLATRKFLYAVAGVTFEITSSAIAPGGAFVHIGLYKNGVLVGSMLDHNSSAQYLNVTTDVKGGDILTIEGYTDNAGVTLSLTNLSIWKAVSVTPTNVRSPHFITRFIEGDF